MFWKRQRESARVMGFEWCRSVVEVPVICAVSKGASTPGSTGSNGAARSRPSVSAPLNFLSSGGQFELATLVNYRLMHQGSNFFQEIGCNRGDHGRRDRRGFLVNCIDPLCAIKRRAFASQIVRR